jgi:hypothetical protein
MDDKKFKIAGLLILAVGAYFLYSRVKLNQKVGDVDAIISSGNSSNKPVLLTFQKEFLSAWASAIKQSIPTFVFENKTYNTKGGKAIK